MPPSLDVSPVAADARSVECLLLAAAMAAVRLVRIVLLPATNADRDAIVGRPLRFQHPDHVVVLPRPDPARHAAAPECVALPLATVARVELIECAATR